MRCATIQRGTRLARARRLSLVCLFCLALFPASLAAEPVVGMTYSIHQCLGTNDLPRYAPSDSSEAWDTTRILAGSQSWGDYTRFHWWGRPKLGYYCGMRATSSQVFVQHARWLREAGVDFVAVDFSNAFKMSDPDVYETMTPSYERMLAAWQTVYNETGPEGPKPPRIVPFIPLTSSTVAAPYGAAAASNIEQLALDRLFLSAGGVYNNLRFMFEGKPLVLLVANPAFPPDSARESLLQVSNSYTSTGFTTRWMWARLANPGTPTLAAYSQTTIDSWWSYLEQCEAGFLASTRKAVCKQRVATRAGAVEQITLNAHYGECVYNSGQVAPGNVQTCWSSYSPSSVPNTEGKTFLSQLQTVIRHREAKVVLISGWNNWINQREPYGECLDKIPHPTIPDGFICVQFETLPDGSEMFIDGYNAAYNSDFEPSCADMTTPCATPNDFNFRLLKAAIKVIKPAGFTGNWGTFLFGWQDDVPFLAPLDADDKYRTVVYRRLNGLGYWYIDTSAAGTLQDFDVYHFREVQFGLATAPYFDEPTIVYAPLGAPSGPADGKYHLAVKRGTNIIASVDNMTYNPDVPNVWVCNPLTCR
jgi:hypothetical protein